MGHDVFLQAHLYGGDQKIPTAEILKCFSPFIKERRDTYVDLALTEIDSCTVFLNTKSLHTTALIVSRPCGDDRLAEGLFEIMGLGNFALFQGSSDVLIVLREETVQHLPEGMVESFARVRVAPDLESFMEAWENP